MAMKGISVFMGMIVGSKRILDEGLYEDTKKLYHNPEFVASYERVILDHERAVELSMCAKLAEDMCAKGATPDEFQKLATYAYICMDAIKYDLDFYKAAEDFGIRDLAKKYFKPTNHLTKGGKK